MSQIIKPTIGRVVWYWPESKPPGWQHYDEHGLVHHVQPFPALIQRVWNDELVDIIVFDPYFTNTPFPLRCELRVVLWIHKGETKFTRFCEWMPFQRGQATNADSFTTDVKSFMTAVAENTIKQHERFQALEQRLTTLEDALRNSYVNVR